MTREGHGLAELGRGRFLRLVSRDGWEYAERVGVGGVVVIVAVTPDDRLVLTEQERPAVGARVIDLPAGLAGDEPGQADEPLPEAARRELLEETGWACATLDWLFEGPPSPGTTSEILTFFRARGLERAGRGGGVGNECIEVHEVPVDGVRGWLSRAAGPRRLIDPKVHAALSLLGR